MILNGFMGTIYVRAEEDSRIDLWESDVWPNRDDVLNEMLEYKEHIVEILSKNTTDYAGFIGRDDETCDYDPEKDLKNEEYFDRFEMLIAEARANLKTKRFDDSYNNVEIVIATKKTHVPELTEYEWAKICGSTAL